MSYASQTYVSPERSQMEIQSTLRRYGATRFGSMEEEKEAHILFTINSLNVQISVPLPDRTDKEFCQTSQGKPRSVDQSKRLYEQKIKSQWRALYLAIKSKLVAIETGISTIENEFMAWVVLPDGKTLGDKLTPYLKEGKLPHRLLTQLEDRK